MQTSFWNTFWGQMSIELMGGIVGSFIFLFTVLWFFKPKVKICHFLCRKTSVNPNHYHFKFVNKSFFSAHDISVELLGIKKVPRENGTLNNIYKPLTLINGKISHIPARKFFWNKNANNLHCIVVTSVENINQILADEMQGIVLKVSLKHGLTGLAKVSEREYFDENDVKIGKFTTGTKFGFI